MLAERPSVSHPLDGVGSRVESLERRRFSGAEFHAMAEAGVLGEDERVELIAGEIVQMTPIGSRHAGCVKSLNRLLSRLLGDRGLVSVQDPIVVDEASEPQPDIAVLRFRQDSYRTVHPQAADVLLVIEVAETSVEYDLRVKIPLYARAGIPEAWLVRLLDGSIEIYRDPAVTGYREMRTLRAGDSAAPRAFPDLALTVAEILG